MCYRSKIIQNKNCGDNGLVRDNTIIKLHAGYFFHIFSLQQIRCYLHLRALDSYRDCLRAQPESGRARFPAGPGLPTPRWHSSHPSFPFEATARECVLRHPMTAECLPGGTCFSKHEKQSCSRRQVVPALVGLTFRPLCSYTLPKQVCAMVLRAEKESREGGGGCMEAKRHFT